MPPTINQGVGHLLSTLCNEQTSPHLHLLCPGLAPRLTLENKVLI
jgi:hypothetical protein